MILVKVDNFRCRQIQIGPPAVNGYVGGEQHLAVFIDTPFRYPDNLGEDKCFVFELLPFAYSYRCNLFTRSWFDDLTFSKGLLAQLTGIFLSGVPLDDVRDVFGLTKQDTIFNGIMG